MEQPAFDVPGDEDEESLTDGERYDASEFSPASTALTRNNRQVLYST
jgi:hypothetical protein